MNNKYYVNVQELMKKYNLELEKPKIKIISITVPAWSDLNVYKS